MTGKHLQARRLRQNSTEAEQRMWLLLRDRRLKTLKFRRQTPIGPYIVDFFCTKKNLIIELDGGQHGVRAGQDQARTDWLSQHGYCVIRFWNNELLENPEGVLTKILELRNPADGNSSPLPLRERVG